MNSNKNNVPVRVPAVVRVIEYVNYGSEIVVESGKNDKKLTSRK
jgi:hypothetical protein